MKIKQSKPEPLHDFSPGLLAAVKQPPSPLPRVMLYILLLLLLFLIVWSFFGQLDIVARAQGKLIPQTRLKIVQPLEGGRVSEILVRDGDVVKAGQTLLLMDTRLSEADTRKLKKELESARIQMRRINAELLNQEFKKIEGDDDVVFEQVAAQSRAHKSEYTHALGQQKAILSQAEKEIASAKVIYQKLKETLPIHVENEVAVSKLGETGYASKFTVLETQRQRIEAERELQSQEFEIQSLLAKKKEASEKIKQLTSANNQQLLNQKIELDNRIAQLEQDWLKQQYRNELMELKAPQDGVVKDLSTSTEGSIVPAGTVLMSVVPLNEPLQAEVYIDNKDVGFVTSGQEVKVKMMSYEFQKYGMIDAIVEYVGADASDRATQAQGVESGNGQSLGYRTLIALNQQHLARNGKTFDLRPGMQVTAEIKIGSRSVLDYVLSPVQRAVNEAGTER